MFNAVISLIKSWTNKIGHTCIKNGKLLVRALFHIGYLANKTSALTNHSTT